MDAKFAELISLFRYAENALLIERNYFDERADDPFLSSEERLAAMTAMTQLDAKLAELRARKDLLIAAYEGGTLPPPSPEGVAKVKAAAAALSEALSHAASALAVVQAATDFFGAVGTLDPAAKVTV